MEYNVIAATVSLATAWQQAAGSGGFGTCVIVVYFRSHYARPRVPLMTFLFPSRSTVLAQVPIAQCGQAIWEYQGICIICRNVGIGNLASVFGLAYVGKIVQTPEAKMRHAMQT